MKFYAFVILLLLSNISFAQFTGTNTAIHAQEQVEQDRAKARQESNNATITPNSPSSPTKVDTTNWGFTSTETYEITNHLLGYSQIMEDGRTLKGVKLTGILNIAYYSADKQLEAGRSKGRLVFGAEIPTYTISNRFEVFTGLGLSIGDYTALYVDAGVDFRLTSWFKIQGGLNWNTGYGSIAPQISAGFVW
jgi:hypothetical protein